MRLKDKVAIVTGATRGIGRAIAVRFGQEGARVAVVGRDKEKGRETVRLIEAAGGQAIFVPADVSDSAQVQAMVDAVVDRWGRIDILVNNAAICPFQDFLEMSEALWDQVLDVNLKGYFLCSQAVARVMVEQGNQGTHHRRQLHLGRVWRQPTGPLLRIQGRHQSPGEIDGHLAGTARHHLQRRPARHRRDRHQPRGAIRPGGP